MRRNLPLVFAILLLGFSSLTVSEAGAQEACRGVFESSAAPTSSQTLQLKNYAEKYVSYVPAVQDMITLGIERYGRRAPRGYCYRAVKNLLLDSGLIRRRVDGTFASSAHTKNFLVNRGFINLLERAPFAKAIKGAYDENIPLGAILVYEGTNGKDGTERALGEGIGHIEVKCGPRCYLFDTVNEFPGGTNQIREPGQFEGGTGLERRRLIGVYILDYFSLF